MVEVLKDYCMNNDGKASLNIQPQRTQIHTFDSFHKNTFHVKFSLNGPLKNFPRGLFTFYWMMPKWQIFGPITCGQKLKAKCKIRQIILAHYKRIQMLWTGFSYVAWEILPWKNKEMMKHICELKIISIWKLKSLSRSSLCYNGKNVKERIIEWEIYNGPVYIYSSRYSRVQGRRITWA